ncbi:hypothetical protein [Candidatus Formimonas warabiya]|nr:hypothetical protein [Candidatus Formimonas warabiya]
MKKTVAKTLMFMTAAKIIFEAVNRISESFLKISKKYQRSKIPRA